MLSLIYEELPPVRVGACDLHFIASTIALNVPRLVVGLGSDCQGLLMEVPFLSVSTISDLNNKVIANEIKVSVLWQL